MQQHRSWRAAGMVTAIAAGAVVLAACGGSSPAGSSPPYQKAAAYAQCMRSHGEPGFPEPNSAGNFSLARINLESQQYQLASGACQDVLPHAAQFQLSSAEQQAIVARALKVAQCMRARGIANFPDPSGNVVVRNGGVGVLIAGTGQPQSQLQSELDSPQGQAAWKTCQASVKKGGGA
jgi:hypothetical protein